MVPSDWTSFMRCWNFPISADIFVKVDNQTSGGECWLRCWAPRKELKFPDTHSHPDLLPNTADNHLNSAPAFNISRTCLTFFLFWLFETKSKQIYSWIFWHSFWLNTQKEMSKHFIFLQIIFISPPAHTHAGYASFCSYISIYNQCPASFCLLFVCSYLGFIQDPILGYFPASSFLSNSWTDIQDLCHFGGSEKKSTR